MLREHPDVVRVLTGAFELHHLPTRVEMRIKPTGKVIDLMTALKQSLGAKGKPPRNAKRPAAKAKSARKNKAA